MPLSDAHRSYLVRDQMVAPFVINFGLNAAIPWFMFKPLGELGVWSSPGVVGDMVATMLILPVLVCVIATPLVRKLYRDGKVPPLASASDVPGWARWLPGNLFMRAIASGLVVAAVTAPLIFGLCKLLPWQAVGVGGYALAKGVACGLVAVVISPPIALRAILDVLTVGQGVMPVPEAG